jgi:mono/diheme cytochrome c family protein
MSATTRGSRRGAGCMAGLLLTASVLHAQEHPGQAVYDRWCAECHGFEGRGDGAAADWMLPRPRDLTQARYQVRTTPSGALPTDADIHRIIERGMPGTAMPAWPKLTRRDREQVVQYIKTLSPFFESEETPSAITLSGAPRRSADVIAEGRRLYDELECWKCHGSAGRGDGTSAPTQEDDNGNPIRPANLTQNWRFNGGGSVDDIYMRLRTGMDGTPMPSFSDVIESEIITEGQLWSIAHFVRSLAPDREPVARDVIRAALSGGRPPETVDDEAWDNAPLYYIPLVGQIVARPRWFAPTVTSVWVQALHDGRELSLRLSWDDPSRSPDPAWEPWRAAVTGAMQPDDGVPYSSEPLPDAFAVQFPAATSVRDLPYFLMGDAREPVYLWSWRSDRGVEEALARGPGSIEALPPDGAPVVAQATFADGRWQLVMRRALVAQDTALRTSFPTAQPIAIAFYAWDGSNGETGGRGSIGSWYYLHLEEPVTAGVYVTPLLAVLITAALGLLIVARARKYHFTTPATPVRES